MTNQSIMNTSNQNTQQLNKTEHKNCILHRVAHSANLAAIADTKASLEASSSFKYKYGDHSPLPLKVSASENGGTLTVAPLLH